MPLKITFILGAGFSIPAGFPSGHTLNEKFFATIENKILRHSSGEWSWDDYGDATSNNGRLNFDYLKYSYLLSELVEIYQKETFQVFDYEEFYDWLNSKFDDENLIKDACVNVNRRLVENFDIKSDSEHNFTNVSNYILREIKDIYNHLISDLLIRDYNIKQNIEYYNPIFKLMEQSTSTDIITLNHDVLLEYLLNNNNVDFSNGFKSDESLIIGENGEKLEVFQDFYPSKIKLLKLHGSVDQYIFNEMETDGLWQKPTGKYHFFKANYRNKHFARRVNCKGEVVQDFNSVIVSQFLTGKSKLDLISQHSVYSKIYNRFKISLENTDKLIIIGYSYRDKHINEIIKTYMDNYDFQIINVNPSVQFPFRKNYLNSKIINLKSISDL